MLKKGYLLLTNTNKGYVEVKSHNLKRLSTMGCAQSCGQSSHPLKYQSSGLWNWHPNKGFQCQKFLAPAYLLMFSTTAIIGRQFFPSCWHVILIPVWCFYPFFFFSRQKETKTFMHCFSIWSARSALNSSHQIAAAFSAFCLCSDDLRRKSGITV